MQNIVVDEWFLQGKAEGLVEGGRMALLAVGRKKLGEPDAATLHQLQSITDFGRFTRMSEVVMDVSAWSELLAVQ